MHCTKKITKDITWVGSNDRRLAMFEGVYAVPDGVSYNSYLLLDDKTVLFDTVDKAVSKVFFENINHVLDGRSLDYVVIHHMEPDHSATLCELVQRYPNVKIICNQKTAKLLKQFFSIDVDSNLVIVKEGDIFETGHHSFKFLMAPMVHWPEVMVSYDLVDKILFSADAFGTFKALNGAIFADEVDFDRDYLDEARRYYCNIVGKYGDSVQRLLKKAENLEIKLICPLHGFVWRENIAYFLEKYNKWSRYEAEENGVMIAYASVYGNTENVAEILSSRLRDKGIKTAMYDVSVTPSSYIVSEAFKWSHLVFASTTYNAGVFISMDEVLRDIAAHNLQNKTVALIENGSWAPTSAKLMREILSSCKNMKFISDVLTVNSSLKEDEMQDLDKLFTSISEDFIKPETEKEKAFKHENAVFNISYGLYVLISKDNDKDNACIINTFSQISDAEEKTFSLTINKQNYSHDMIMHSEKFNISMLNEDAPFDIFKTFGFKSGRDTDKFENFNDVKRSANGLVYLNKYSNSYISCEVIETVDCDTHTMFIAKQTESKILDTSPSLTYSYYFKHIKPKSNTEKSENKKKKFVCTVCGYEYEGEFLPADFVCPLCKHGAEVFELVE